MQQQRRSAITCLSFGQPTNLKCQNLHTLKFHYAEYASSKVSVKGKPMGGAMKVGGVKVEEDNGEFGFKPLHEIRRSKNSPLTEDILFVQSFFPYFNLDFF